MRQTLRQRPAGGDSAIRTPQPAADRSAFTLVELLVVIAIIGVLTALLIAAASGALGTAKQAQVTAEMTQMATALEDHKNNVGSYPPNTQVDGTSGLAPIDDKKVLSAFRRHLLKTFPNHREPENLIAGLVGHVTNGSNVTVLESPVPDDIVLDGGMTAAEAIVFWLGGFSDDPKYPISGPGGPSYSLSGVSGVDRHKPDPIDNRNWKLDINQAQLGPRGDNNYFNPSSTRYIQYDDPVTPGNQRRINFWTLSAPSSPLRYVYFDASRASTVTAQNDPPAATALVAGTVNADLRNVYAIKTVKASSLNEVELLFANDNKFQILHGGLDEDWGDFPRLNPSAPAVTPPLTAGSNLMIDSTDTASSLVYPAGPWTLELADTIASFATGTLEDAQP